MTQKLQAWASRSEEDYQPLGCGFLGGFHGSMAIVE
jgi:hypothetical protein